MIEFFTTVIVFFQTLFAKLAALPVAQPFLALLHSRRFTLGVVTFLVNLAIAWTPTLPPQWADRLFLISNLAAGILLLGLSVEDTIAARKELPATPDALKADLLQQLTDAVIEAIKVATAPVPAPVNPQTTPPIEGAG